jgi:hypothetical protein
VNTFDIAKERISQKCHDAIRIGNDMHAVMVKIGRSMAQLESTHSKTAGKYGTWRKRMGVEIAESLPKSTSSTALLPLKNDLLPNGAKLPSHVLRQ